jgi:transcriptional regulator with XRE-family HTH domain
MDKSQHTEQYRRLLEALRKAREQAGLTQGEVAQRLDTYASFISKVEAGERRIDVVELAALCRVYGIKLVALLTEAGFCEDAES